MKKAKKPLWKRIVIAVLCVILVCALAIAGLLLAILITEYNPEPEEAITAEGEGTKSIRLEEPIRLLSWNIGYCGLGAEEDFFMDGGKGVFPSSQENVKRNFNEIEAYIQKENADVVFLQEVDVDATRTKHLNEMEDLKTMMDGYASTFATNFKVLFIPYPIPPMGHEDGGIQTFSRYNIFDATRIQLPCPFTGIERIGNLKRCLLISRVDIADSDKELVLINLHLEAYDSGEGKIAQTKMLYEVMESEYAKGNYVVVAGDFNQVFDSVDDSMYPTLSEENWAPGKIAVADFGEHWNFLMDNTHPTCRSLDQPYLGVAPEDEFQYFMIDGCIVSDNIRVESIETKDLRFQYSDHNPIELTFYLSDKE